MTVAHILTIQVNTSSENDASRNHGIGSYYSCYDHSSTDNEIVECQCYVRLSGRAGPVVARSIADREVPVRILPWLSTKLSGREK